MNRAEAERYIEGILNQLSEHFPDGVQILATRMAPEGKGTERFFMGSGNWYARQGMAQAFIKADEARTVAEEIGDKLEPPPDDAEQWKKE